MYEIPFPGTGKDIGDPSALCHSVGHDRSCPSIYTNYNRNNPTLKNLQSFLLKMTL